MALKIGGKVEKVNGKELNYNDFSEKYLAQNQPVILTGLTEHWRACKDWVSDEGKLNFPFFSDSFGTSKVQVADCGTREFTDQKRMAMSVSEFIDQWVKSSDNGENGDDDDDDDDDDGKSLYLKDWHFVKEYPEYTAYSTPVFFLDDWLNLYLDKYRMHNDPDTKHVENEICCSDYRFVYMGAKGTWTPLHADVFRSYSWSTNVCGRKQWYFLSPSQHHLVFDRYMKNSVYNIFEDVCKVKFPGFEKVIWLECTQEPNEIIFVPSGWYHQVHNLEDTISINHNWFNAYNIPRVWDLLLREYEEAKWYIEDIKDICDDFEGLCQKNLAANAGMNFHDFFIFLIRFALANLVLLNELTSNEGDSQNIGFVHFNLKSIKDVALKMKDVAAWGNCVNIKEIIEDTLFMEFTTSLGRAYSMMFDQNGKKLDWSETLLQHDQFNLFDSHICNPRELVKFVDGALKLVGIASK